MLAPLLALAMQTSQPVPESGRGSSLYKECLGTIRLMDGKNTGADSMLSNSCLGYIDGFTDGLLMASPRIICLGGASLGTLARVYVTYMAANPKLMDAEKAVGLVDALLENYACPVPKK